MTVAINFPTNTKIIGSNVLSIFPNNLGVDAIWNGGWASTWPYLQKAIDLAYGMGCNCIRMVGDCTWLSGGINQATYDAQWAQFLNYTDSLGLYVYPCLQGAGQIGTLTINQMIGVMTDTLDAMVGRSLIIGVDLVNEANNVLSISDSITLLDGVRAGGSGFAMGMSTFESFTSVPTWENGIIAHVDFADFHVYRTIWGTAPTAADIVNGPFTWWDRDVIFGEFGDPKSNGTSANAAWFASSVACFPAQTIGRGTMRGGLHWNIFDQDTVSTNQYGAFSLSWNPYTQYVVGTVNASGTSSTPSAPSTPVLAHDDIILSSPHGSCSDYSTMKIYRGGALLATQNDGRYSVPTNGSYTFSVVNGSASESAQSAPLLVTTVSPKSGPFFGR